jgi:hypothetical protein
VEEENKSITRQRCCKHISAITEADVTMEQLLEKKCNKRQTVGGFVFYAVLPEAIPGTEMELQSVVSSRDCESAGSQY